MHRDGTVTKSWKSRGSSGIRRRTAAVHPAWPLLLDRVQTVGTVAAHTYASHTIE